VVDFYCKCESFLLCFNSNSAARRQRRHPHPGIHER